MYYYKAQGGIIAVINPIDDAEAITADEYIKLKTAIKKPAWTDQMQEQYERTRPLTESEVARLLIARQINTLSVDDQTAVRMTEFYPSWASGQAYTAGYKVQHGGKLWRCLQDHTSQDGWEPESAPSLWAKVLIPDETVVPEWEQPDSTNGYMTGDKVTHNGKTWVSDIDNNVWEPGVHGWTEASA